MNAVRGLFNSESERLALQDDIRIATSSGLVGKLTYATIEMDSQIIRSHSPVTFDMPSATLRANALTLRSSESTLIFRGKVRLHIDRTEKKEEGRRHKCAAPGQGAARAIARARGAERGGGEAGGVNVRLSLFRSRQRRPLRASRYKCRRCRAHPFRCRRCHNDNASSWSLSLAVLAVALTVTAPAERRPSPTTASADSPRARRARSTSSRTCSWCTTRRNTRPSKAT